MELWNYAVASVEVVYEIIPRMARVKVSVVIKSILSLSFEYCHLEK